MLSAAALAGCDTGSNDSSTSAIDEALALITAPALKAHVDYLADDELAGRKPGEAGYETAASYVAEQFAAMGVSPGGTDDYHRRLRCAASRPTSTTSPLQYIGTAWTPSSRSGDEFSMDADPAREETSVRAPVVYVGRGVHAPEFWLFRL